jgi:hypothetical protein
MLEAPNPNFQIPGKSQVSTNSDKTTDNEDGTDHEKIAEQTPCRASAPLAGQATRLPTIYFVPTSRRRS